MSEKIPPPKSPDLSTHLINSFHLALIQMFKQKLINFAHIYMIMIIIFLIIKY